MLRDNLFNRLFRSELRENGLNRVVSNITDAPETTVEHADNTRGISINDLGLLRAEDDSVPEEPGLTFSDISHRVWDMQRTWDTLRGVRDSGLYYNTVIDRAPDYLRMDDSPEKLEKLKKSIADMVSRREQVFRRSSSSDEKIADYGYELVELFKELYPDMYQQAIECSRMIDHATVSTDS